MQDDRSGTTEPWDGYPLNPEHAGWHLLRWISVEYRPPYDEAWHYDPTADLCWIRRENGFRGGWRAKHIGRNWAYVGCLYLHTL